MEHRWKDNYRLLTLRYFYRIASHVAFFIAIYKSIVENWFQVMRFQPFFWQPFIIKGINATHHKSEKSEIWSLLIKFHYEEPQNSLIISSKIISELKHWNPPEWSNNCYSMYIFRKNQFWKMVSITKTNKNVYKILKFFYLFETTAFTADLLPVGINVFVLVFDLIMVVVNLFPT